MPQPGLRHPLIGLQASAKETEMRYVLPATMLTLSTICWTQLCQGQDVGPAIDPGVGTAVASMDVLRQSEERRARGTGRHGYTASRTAQTCANARAMRSRHRGDPRFARLLQLCDMGGY